MKTSRTHTTATTAHLAYRAMRERPVLAVGFLVLTFAQGLLQGLLVWALRAVLLSFGKHGREAAAAVALTAIAIFAIWAARAGAAFAAEVMAAKLAHGVEVATMWKILAKLLTLSSRFFDKNSAGDLVMATYADVQHIRQITLALGNVVLHITRLLGLVAVAWLMSPKLTVIGLVSVPFGAWPALWLGERIKDSARRERGSVRYLYDSFLQVAQGIRIIKVNGGERRVLDRARETGTGLASYLVNQVRARSFAKFLL